MNIEKMREEFEVWADSCELPIGKQDGVYEVRSVDWLWLGWRSSREALVIELPSEEPGYMYYAPDVVEAIEAAGAKCK